ncbi:hypothetical protein KP78_19460 [Jeotgalibacillus soli]|uniref:Uncharacterized protein n=1 Tax=Jeotgalibacillus soli TaxID=889306 RepID=A0A0C2V9H2_9BACL|nr:hypothetical protein KP78_19460 [Jeotgalibacillus soli]
MISKMKSTTIRAKPPPKPYPIAIPPLYSYSCYSTNDLLE